MNVKKCKDAVIDFLVDLIEKRAQEYPQEERDQIMKGCALIRKWLNVPDEAGENQAEPV